MPLTPEQQAAVLPNIKHLSEDEELLLRELASLVVDQPPEVQIDAGDDESEDTIEVGRPSLAAILYDAQFKETALLVLLTDLGILTDTDTGDRGQAASLTLVGIGLIELLSDVWEVVRLSKAESNFAGKVILRLKQKSLAPGCLHDLASVVSRLVRESWVGDGVRVVVSSHESIRSVPLLCTIIADVYDISYAKEQELYRRRGKAKNWSIQIVNLQLFNALCEISSALSQYSTERSASMS